MKRLTKEDILNVSKNSSFILPRLAGKQMSSQIINELLEYKTAEEGFGVDLIILSKGLKQEEVYVKLPNGKIDKCSFIVEKFWDNVFGFTYPVYEDSIYYFLKDYGETWALTKKELELE